MGHGDDLAIVDANFPAESIANNMAKDCLRSDASATEILIAILSVMPLDTFVPNPALTMAVVGSDDTPAIVHDFQTIVNQQADNPVQLTPIERFQFYEKAKTAFAIVQTNEQRLYGNIMLKKGVVKS